MASQVSPGVVLRERDLTNATIVGDSALTAAIVSSFQKGPIDQIVNIADQKSLISVFGTPKEANAEDWLVASEFLGYGGRLAVVRASSGVTNAANGGALLLRMTLHGNLVLVTLRYLLHVLLEHGVMELRLL